MSNVIEIQLSKPLTLPSGEDATVLRRDFDARPLTAGDLQVLDDASGEIGKMINFVAKVFALTPGMVTAMPASDFKAAAMAVQPFLL